MSTSGADGPQPVVDGPGGRSGSSVGTPGPPPGEGIVAAEGVDRRVVSVLLRTGLALASALIAAGLAVKLLRGDHQAVVVRLFDIGGTRALGDRLLASGVAVLALTPATRVLALVVLWAREGDRRFVVVALVVIAVLIAAAAIGHG